ncbi:MAG: chemotaxis protein CheW [Sulfurimonas sp.]|jgi:chemotaxis signal transduction protein|nr:chemotaxis protein CheW [Sulfurimonas sp.]
MMDKLVEYKNFKISPELLPLIKYMEPVEQSREKLNDLSRNWDSLSLLSQLGDAGVNMNKIKNNFSTLSSELINYLGTELLKKSVSEMNTKAQVAVYIVIRNLFERTADIGFLATDKKIRDFLQNNHTKYTDNFNEHLKEIQKRFIEYTDKYSVYFDIVLMNTNGDILANIDDTNKILKSNDSLIKQALNTSQEYVETYKYHDFIPQHKESLVYSYKVTQNNDDDSKALGVLCLCFKFEDEMSEVFSNLINPQTKECITILNESGNVIATSDQYHIPLEAQLEVVLDGSYKIVSFGGRDYLAKSCETSGYQGFFGLGWYGHIMVPLDHAFSHIGDESFEISQELLLAILQHGDQFSERLKNIPIQASDIQNNLNRAIWNGNIKQSNSKNDNKQFSRALLQEIRKTGENTKDIIGSSMANLTKTMVLGDSLFLADLILDIMDRNLYERANDCRWWALTPDFRKILENEKINAYEREDMSNILSYINDLYTVYTNLFIYDKNGVVVAVSKKSEEHLIGRKLSDEWVAKTLEIKDSSKYYVSAFEQSNLYDSKHTYIYNAPIRSLENEERVLGGIGIVFDSSVQFEAMINESLPKQSDGSIKDGLYSVLTTKDQTIIASNNSDYVSGKFFNIQRKFFDLEAGESLSEIIEYEGKYYALGVQCSKGYREYKSQEDDYINNVYNFLFSYISDVEETVVDMNEKFALEKDISMELDENSIDVASFMIGSQWLGIDALEVVEAISITELKSTIKMESDHHFKGTIIYKDSVISIIDIQNFLQGESVQEYEEIVILKFGSEDGYIGILVNSLSDIPEVHTDRIKPLQEYIIGNGTLIESVVFPIKEVSNEDILSILSIKKINNGLVSPNRTHMIPQNLSA